MPTELADQPVFAGKSRHVMDMKNRITIPARWRREDKKDKYYVLPVREKDHLLVYPPLELERKTKVAEEKSSRSVEEKRLFTRRLYSSAQFCELDPQGRLLLPEDLRQGAGLNRDVFLIGSRTWFEIWRPGPWEQKEAVEDPTFQDMFAEGGF